MHGQSKGMYVRVQSHRPLSAMTMYTVHISSIIIYLKTLKSWSTLGKFKTTQLDVYLSR